MTESVASLPCQPTSPARKVCVTSAPVQRRQYQARVPPTTQTNSMYELGCVYGSAPRRKQPETKSSWSTSNLSNSTVENNQCHYPSADIRASGDFGSSTSLSSINARTYNNMAQPYKAPMHFEKTHVSTPLHRNMQLGSKERLLTFNSNAPVSLNPPHASVVKPIPRYLSSNLLASDVPVVAPVHSVLAQRIAHFTQHGARSARPFVSRRAHTVDLATIQQRWSSAMQHARPRGSVSAVTEPVREKPKPWYNPAYDHQMLQLDHAMQQLREEIADVDVMLDRKSVAKTLDVNSNVTRSTPNKSNQRCLGSGNIAVTAEPPIIISPASDFNVERGATMDKSSRDAAGLGGSDLSHCKRLPQQLRVAELTTEPLQRASSFDTADTRNKFRRVHETADLSGRSGLKEPVLPHKEVSLQRLAEPVVEPRQRASSFDTSDRQSKLTAASPSRLGQKERIVPYTGVSPVFAPLERSTSFDTSGTLAFPFAAEISHLNPRQEENVLPYRTEPRHRLAFVSSPQLTTSFDRTGMKDGSMQNSDTWNKNARKGCALSAEHVPTIDSLPVPPNRAPSDVCASTRSPNTSLLDTLPVETNHSSPSSPSSYFVPIDPLGDTTNSHSVVTDQPPVVIRTTPIKQPCTVDVSSLTNLFSPPDPTITEPYSSTAQSMTLEPAPLATATVPSVADSPVKSAFRRTDPNHRAKLVKQHSAPSNFLESEPETETPTNETETKNFDKNEWEETFNRPDSPLATPLLLPKESSIIRNRCQRSDSSSSSNEYDSLSSPQRSPRTVRRKKLDKAHTLESIDSRRYLAVPGQR